jgi:16S rRNA (guanine527-N7)-methyltransferase
MEESMALELELSELLKKGALQYEKTLTEQHIEQFTKYMELLKDWNKKINLTAIEDDREIIIKHFIDSLSILPYVQDKEQRLIDVGTGAGFPGIPLKIVNKNIEVTLLDSLDKRVKFLNEVINSINISQIKAVHGRAEDLGISTIHREKYDIAVARAVANLPVLLEYCLPFVKINGVFIAMKGSNTEEFDNCGKALDILGGKIEKIEKMELPFTNIERNVVVVRKFRQTPTKYPRKAGKPVKEPLI